MTDPSRYAEPVVATISWQRFFLPLRSPFGAAHGRLAEREGLLVRIATPGGESGLGEASPLPSFAGGSATEAAQALRAIAEQARGRPLEELWQVQFRPGGCSQGSAAAALCGFETAVATALAARAGQPLCRWLAAQTGAELPQGAIAIPVNAVIDASEPAVAAAHAARAVAAGYTTLKVKVGLDLVSDVARVTSIREAVGQAVVLRIDANGAWSDRAVALAALERLAALGISLCEQPLAPAAGHQRMGELARQSPIPLAIDEGCRSVGDLREAVRWRAADTVIVKPMVTGLREAMAILALARTEGLETIVTTTFDSGVGTMLAAHLAALLPELRPACGLSTLEYLERDIVAGVPPIQLGLLRIPDECGLGVTVDESALAQVAAGPQCEAPL